MPIKKIELEFHPANPLNEIVTDVNNNFESILSSFDTLNAGQGVVGPQGDRGERGEPGVNGVEGAPGKDGLPGKDGKDGLPGRDGVDGVHGRDGAAGPQGAVGATGATGATGPQGLKGDTGATGTAGAQGVAGVGIKGFVSGYVDAGQFVTLDNLKFTVTTGGSRGLSCATVTGTVNLSISGTFGYINGVGGSATGYPGPSYNTTPSGSWFGWSFPNAGDGSTYLINDYTNQRFYRVTLMIGAGYLKNFISIERLY